VELWAAAPAGCAEALPEQLLGPLVTARGLDVGALRDRAYVRRGGAAVRHLCRVASGLDSMVVGEGQIAGQLRRALRAAHGAGTLGAALHRLGAVALEVAKGQRASGCPRSVTSVAHAAVAAARARLGALAGRAVLVVGAGEMAGLALAALRGPDAPRVTVVNRTAERARALVACTGARVRPWEELADAARDADVVIACVGAPAPVLDAATLAGGRTRLCLDLGVPAAVDPRVRERGIVVEDMDTLAARAHAASAAHAAWLADAERRVEVGVRRFTAWRRQRAVAPAIRELHAHAARVRDAETARARARLRAGDAPADEVLDALARRLVAKLLHVPVAALKGDGRDAAALAAALTAALEPRP
jgi:glutamyl-tRNA reductase